MAPYLAPGLPAGGPSADDLDAPYWAGLKRDRLFVQRCFQCKTWQWGPEWMCHACLSFDLVWEQVVPQGLIYSWTRVWHPTHDALREQGPYIIALVALPAAGSVRMIGNLLGDPLQDVVPGQPVQGVFEHNGDHTLLQWRQFPL